MTASVQESSSAARTHVQGLLDVAITLRVRWQFHDVLGLELESGLGYALIGYQGASTASLAVGWREWWVPIRASFIVRLA